MRRSSHSKPNLFTSTRSRLIRAGIVGGTLLCASYSAHAGWLSNLGALLTVIGAAIFLAAVPIAAGLVVAVATVQIVAIALTTAGVAAVLTDYATALGSEAPVTPPPSAALPEPPPPSLPGSIRSDYQPIPLPGNQADPIVAATNGIIGALDTLEGDEISGQQFQFSQDFPALTSAFGSLGNAYSSFFGSQDPVTIAQTDLNANLAQIGSSGFPPSVTATLSGVGLSSSTITGVSSYLGSTQFNLAHSVSGREALSEASQVTQVPEPPAILLLSTGVAGLYAAFCRCGLRSHSA
jgi:hypothetical protein